MRLQDWREAEPAQLGRFDAVASVGAFEHFCSPEAFEAGRQEEIYRRFFGLCADLLPGKGRLFVQTMTLGEKAPPPETLSVDAPRGSDAYLLAVLKRFYPGSFLPLDLDQVVDCAGAWFTPVEVLNGRLDYIRTMDAWGRVWQPSLRTVLAMLRTVPALIRDPDARYKLESIWNGYNKECFRRGVLDHYRVVFERAP